MTEQNWRIRGHDWAVRVLEGALASARVRHAYLITGSQGVGKRLLAHEWVAALFCDHPVRPCGACLSCRQVMAGAHPDLTLVAPSEGRIRIEQVRAAQRELSLSPFQAPRRACIIIDVHQATTEAGNALLKTLEEPPERVVLVLTAIEAGMLPATIVSRCQCLALRDVLRDDIEALLLSRWPERGDEARLVARLARGRMGWAVTAMEQKELLEARAEHLDLLEALVGQGRAARLAAAESLAEREDLGALLDAWQDWWRDVLLVASGLGENAINVDRLRPLTAAARRAGVRGAHAALRAGHVAARQIDQNVNARLALEGMLLAWRRAMADAQPAPA